MPIVISENTENLISSPKQKIQSATFFDVTWKRDRYVYILVIRNLIQASSAKPPFIVKTLHLLLLILMSTIPLHLFAYLSLSPLVWHDYTQAVQAWRHETKRIELDWLASIMNFLLKVRIWVVALMKHTRL